MEDVQYFIPKLLALHNAGIQMHCVLLCFGAAMPGDGFRHKVQCLQLCSCAVSIGFEN